ncbi:MAG: ABC transporter ATP-binding protein [Deltaproteobacteria bacterium]|nr:ABC transporter ATP-binding protein [Deltaproteobacteria bacterium]
MRILEGKGVTKFFGGLAAISKVDFHVDRGEIVGLIGPNGAGKTTLFNLISAAISVDSGEIGFKGKRISGLKSYQVCRTGVARTFQSVRVFPNLSVHQNVTLGAIFGTSSGRSPAEATQEALELLEFVGLSLPGTTLAKDLTLAQQKRLEVARALATKPELLLLDEVIAGLNPTETAEAMELVTRVRQRGVTIMMIEHVMKAIMSICDRIIVLHHGVKIAEGTPKEIVTNRTVIEVYLGE